MAFTSITRLRVRSWRFMPPFLLYALRSSRQARHSAGFLGGALINDKHRTFWTITVWESDAAMKAFRGADAHRTVMARLANWCDEASVAHISDASQRVPDAVEAHRIMREHGRPSRVDHPSPRHAVLRMEAPSRRALPLKAAKQTERAAA